MTSIRNMRTFKMTMMSGLVVSALLINALITSTSAMAVPTTVDKITRKEIAERLASATTVCLVGQPCASASATPMLASGEPRSGESVYGSFCTACHELGVLSAPKKGDKATWDAKLAAAGSYSQLLTNSINGIRAMPPRGTCMDCSDEEISLAIQFMSGLSP